MNDAPETGGLESAIALHRAGKLNEAEAVYRHVLSNMPANASALHLLGVLRHQQGHSEEAANLIRESISQDASNPDAHVNLGNVLGEQGQSEAAEAAYRECLRISPDHAAALSNLGILLKNRGRLEDAMEVLQAAVRASPEHAGAHHNLGRVLSELGRYEEAIEACLRTLKLRPHDPAGYRSLSVLLQKMGHSGASEDIYREWLARDPQNPVARYMTAASTGRGAPERAPDQFLSTMFDAFAAEFDRDLASRKYQGPGVLARMLEAEFGEPAQTLKALDAGCGTGLCGIELRPFCRRLSGVDLSPRMIELAASRGIYDQLRVAELTAFMAARPGCFDLIVSADTLIYLGELETAVAAAGAALLPGGRLIFSLEEFVEAGPDDTFRLEPHGRYVHSRGYIAEVIDGSGLHLNALEPCVIREEGGAPVRAFFITAHKPS